MSKLFTIEIDGENYDAPKKTMTANEILVLGGLDSKEYYLVQIKRDDRIPFKDKGNEEIELFEGAKFVGQYVGKMSVSEK